MRRNSFVHDSGFTLVEIALVLLVLGILTRAAIVPMGSLVERRHHQHAEIQLQEIRQAVFAHLVAYGALPCPIGALSSYTDHQAGSTTDLQATQTLAPEHAQCKSGEGGVPASTLGLSGSLSERQALLDPWGREYIYAVSINSHTELGEPALADWTTPGEAARVGVAGLRATLTLCSRVGQGACARNSIRTDQIAFVVVSAGKDAGRSGAQAENQDSDEYFVLQPHSIESGALFDDLLVWGTAADVIFWMLKMGWLP